MVISWSYMDIQLSLIVLVNVDAGKRKSERSRSNESCVSLHETSHTPILSTSSRHSGETVLIIVTHFRGFEFPVGRGVLDDAKGIDPEIPDTHLAGDGYCVAECL